MVQMVRRPRRWCGLVNDRLIGLIQRQAAAWPRLGEELVFTRLHDANIGLAAHDPRQSDGTKTRGMCG
jgi:hypothetical protein